MTFTSLEYVLFLPLVAAVFFLLPQAFRWLWLLVMSCYFYMYFIPIYILILFLLIGIDYTAGLCIEHLEGRRRKWFLILSLVANCSVLGLFKYYDFINANGQVFLGHMGIHYAPTSWRLALPIGLSFHTFQSLSYTLEVYYKRQKAERHLGIYALYVMFFPQLVAGPIERPQHMLHQFHESKVFSYDSAVTGLRRILWGFFLKLFIADRLSDYVDQAYRNISGTHGITLLVATIFFAVQIYCDFSAYSEIAIGSARLMNFTLMENFDRPYGAASIGEFWKRWHISLSTWFRDYVYIPLGGNRVSPLVYYRNILIVFMLSGMWHGANWTFCIWGLLHGLFYLVSHLWERSKFSALPLPRPLRVAATFSAVCFAWIFFRAATVTDAFLVIRKIAASLPRIASAPWSTVVHFVKPMDFYLSLIGVAMILAYSWMGSSLDVRGWLDRRPVLFRWAFYYGTIAVILLLGTSQNKQFIYFQF